LKTENNRPAEEVSRSPKEAERTKQTDRKRKKRESLYTLSLSLTEEHFRRVRKHTDRRKETNFLSLKQAVHHERVRIRKEEGKKKKNHFFPLKLRNEKTECSVFKQGRAKDDRISNIERRHRRHITTSRTTLSNLARLREQRQDR
jgi:hypothetical protein